MAQEALKEVCLQNNMKSERREGIYFGEFAGFTTSAGTDLRYLPGNCLLPTGLYVMVALETKVGVLVWVPVQEWISIQIRMLSNGNVFILWDSPKKVVAWW